MFGLVDVLFYHLLLLASLVLLLSVKKSCESKVVITCFFVCLLDCTCVYVFALCVCLYVCIMCVLPGVVAIKIRKQTYKQHQVTHIELNELNEHTNNTR